MAYTKIHPIKSTLNKAVEYITNPAKTDEGLLVYSFGCAPKTAAYDFKFSLNKSKEPDGVLAHHLIQSFLPGEVSYEEAHRIGQEYADKLLQGKYSYVLSTHIERKHIHNHIIFCSTDNINYKKYRSTPRSYYALRNLSDEICKEHNLSIIMPFDKDTSPYRVWDNKEKKPSLRQTLRENIDECISLSSSYEEFLKLINKKEIEFKGAGFEETDGKYIAFRPMNAKHFIRGDERSLGKLYTKDAIKERIEVKLKLKDLPIQDAKAADLSRSHARNPITTRKQTGLIDTSAERYTNSPWLLKGAKLKNLQMVASAYATGSSLADLEATIDEQKALVNTTRKQLVALEKSLKPQAEMLHYAKMYVENRKFYYHYSKSKDQERYYREHATEINLFNAAEHALKTVYHVNPATLDLNKLILEYQQAELKRNQLSSDYHSSQKTLSQIETQLEDAKKYLVIEPQEPEKDTNNKVKNKGQTI